MKKWMSLLAVAALSSVTYADVCFDDFNNELVKANAYSETAGNNQSALGESFNYYTSDDDKYYEAGYWYAYNESDDLGGEDGASQATPNYKEDKDFEAMGDNSSENQCLSLNITFGDGVDYPFYGVGSGITIEGDYTDFSSMTSIDFYAKGTKGKKMKVVFKTKEANDMSSDWGDYDGIFTLSEEWTKVSIKKGDVKPSAYSALADEGAGFTSACSQVEKIHFQTEGAKAGDNWSFNLDEIIIKGMDYSDFTSEGHAVYEEYPLTGMGPADGSAIAETKALVSTVELQATPSQFNPTTTINFALPKEAKASLKIYDAAGNLVNTLFNGSTSGTSVNWNATNMNGAKVASGVYFYRLTSGSTVMTKKMILLK